MICLVAQVRILGLDTTVIYLEWHTASLWQRLWYLHPDCLILEPRLNFTQSSSFLLSFLDLCSPCLPLSSICCHGPVHIHPLPPPSVPAHWSDAQQSVTIPSSPRISPQLGPFSLCPQHKRCSGELMYNHPQSSLQAILMGLVYKYLSSLCPEWISRMVFTW